MESEARCNLCGAGRFSPVEESYPPYRALRCAECGLIFVSPQPARAQLVASYGEEYYKGWRDLRPRARRRMWERRLWQLESRLPAWLADRPARGELLDVGCGTGAFLEAARRRGWKIAGTEISPEAARAASRLLGVEVFCGELASARLESDRFDLVTLWHVLEHVADPSATLSECARVLSPGGVMVVAVPNVESRVFNLA